VGTIIDDDVSTGVPESPPLVTSLAPGFPNPFQRVAALPFALREPGPVRIDIFDVQGRLVRRLLDESRSPGVWQVEWNGLDESGGQVPSGVYMARMTAAGRSYTRSLRLIR
jgi:hypothetical protein